MWVPPIGSNQDVELEPNWKPELKRYFLKTLNPNWNWTEKRKCLPLHDKMARPSIVDNAQVNAIRGFSLSHRQFHIFSLVFFLVNTTTALFIIKTWGQLCAPMVQWCATAYSTSRMQGWANNISHSQQPAGNLKHWVCSSHATFV